MEEDLILGEGESEQIEFVEMSDAEYIAAACNALSAVEACNPMTDSDTRRVKRIQRKALAIIDHCLGEMYKEIFDDSSED